MCWAVYVALVGTPDHSDGVPRVDSLRARTKLAQRRALLETPLMTEAFEEAREFSNDYSRVLEINSIER